MGRGDEADARAAGPAGLRGRWLGRAVRGLEVRPDFAVVVLDAVEYFPLAPIPGLLTAETAEEQGLERRLPNAPPIVGGGAPTIPLELSVGLVGPGTLRLRLGVGTETPSSADLDRLDLGMLSGPVPTEAPSVEEGEDWILFSGDGVRLGVRRRPFGLALYGPDRRPVAETGGDVRQVAGFPLAAAMAVEGDGALVSFVLHPGEDVFGFGEQFGPLSKVGQRLELRCDDALGVGTGRVYKAMPVWHSSAGYAGLLHTPGPVVADVGATYPAVLSIATEEPMLDVFLFLQETPLERLSALGALTGRPPEPPRWFLGAWMSRCRYQSRAEVEAVAASLRAARVPIDVLHVDPAWLELDKLNCDFRWSATRFADPASLAQTLRADGFRLSLWVAPYVDAASPRYVELERSGALVVDRTGEPVSLAAITADGRPRGLVDFSREAGRAWWASECARLVSLGVEVVKCDFGEGLPEAAVMGDGRPGRSWRNLYPLWYQRTTAEAVRSAGGTGLLWARSGWLGSSRYPAHWGGDPESSVSGLAATLRGGLSWGLSGGALWGHDIGGFHGPGPSAELYVRWAEVGALSGLCRFHGLGPREPWAFGPEALRIVREHLELRYRLLPYLVHVAAEAARFGWPMMRPLSTVAMDDPYLRRVEHAFLLGSDLLVVAVLDERPGEVDVEVPIPPGEWVDYRSGEVLVGPGRVVVRAGLEWSPLYVRAGALIPHGPVGLSSDRLPAGDWTLRVWAGRPGGKWRHSDTVLFDGPLCHRYALSVDTTGAPDGVMADEEAPRAAAAELVTPAGRRPLPVRRVRRPPA